MVWPMTRQNHICTSNIECTHIYHLAKLLLMIVLNTLNSLTPLQDGRPAFEARRRQQPNLLILDLHCL